MKMDIRGMQCVFPQWFVHIYFSNVLRICCLQIFRKISFSETNEETVWGTNCFQIQKQPKGLDPDSHLFPQERSM